VRKLYAGQPFAYPEIKMVQRARADANEYVVFTQFGVGSVFVLEDFGSTEFVNADGFHGFPPNGEVAQIGITNAAATLSPILP
jgi:hypothetical protein